MEKKSELCWLLVNEGSILANEAVAFLQTPRAGGIDLFIGTTRQWTDGKETVHLEYDCYEAMVLLEMERIAEKAQESWPIERLCIFHRTGVVVPAEASVVIGVATPHRTDAFEACRFLIDTLKTDVPIWKREVYADGQTAWVEGAND